MTKTIECRRVPDSMIFVIRAWQVSNEDMKLLQGVFPTWCAFDSPPFVTSFYVAKSLQAFSQHQLPYEIFFR